MGNKLCKKKSDVVDNSNTKSPSQFDRIINRLHIRPNSWKSDTQLNQKQVKRIEKMADQKQINVIHTKPLSKSSDWTEVDLEVPEKEEPIHLTNPKLNLIFNNENGTPTPPPRKHKRNFREKIEAVAKSGLQAFQSKKPVEDTQSKKPVEEELFVKKTIDYRCPICDQDEVTHNRDHHHHHVHSHLDSKNENKNNKLNNLRNDKDNLNRKKALSVSSLPNYDELKFSVAELDENDKDSPSKIHNRKATTPSEISLPTEGKKAHTGSTGKLDTYITRCRSFGSIFPQQLKKLRPRKAPTDIESDDSFGGLEDWDLGLIEHYNPKDASLPRPRKPQKSDDSILAELEGMVVQEEDIEQLQPPVRKADSLLKKINKAASETAHKRPNVMVVNKNESRISAQLTPPPSPTPKLPERKVFTSFPTEENKEVEHSSLIKILEKFSMEDKQKHKNEKNVNSTESSLTPSLIEFEKSIVLNSIDEAVSIDEKSNTDVKKITNEIKT